MSDKRESFPPEGAPLPSFPYRVEAKVGVGSMGVVYRAVEIELDRPVAIKALRSVLLEDEPPEVQDDIRQRFKQEAKAAAALSHPAVTTVHRVGESNGVPYIVMEWLEGTTLEAMLAERGKLDPRVAVRYVIDLLDALDASHRQGVVHRDIKPANLMVLKADGRLKVTDFGIALLRGRDVVKTRDGLVLATPKFASPEQLAGSEVDGRADLFATGILLYGLLAGVFPFRGAGFMELANAIMMLEPEPLRDIDPTIPAALDAVIRRALMKDRDDRYRTAAAMSEPLRAWLGEQRAAHLALNGTEDDSDDGTAHMPVRRGLPHEPSRAILRVVESWPARVLTRQSTTKLLERLLDRPLHAPAFSGAAVIGTICLLLHDGLLLGAIDTTTGEHGDAVAGRLPPSAAARLHTVPPMFTGRVIELLATVLLPPQVRIGDLDSSFINLPALAEKLGVERFEGILRLRFGQDLGLLLFDRGKAILSLFSSGWEDVPIESSWQRWAGSITLSASIEEKVVQPLALWYALTLRNLAFEVAFVSNNGDAPVEPRSTSSSRMRQMIQSPRTGALPVEALHLRRVGGDDAVEEREESRYEHSPAFRTLQFALRELPGRIAEVGRANAWKYLTEWLPMTRRAVLYHQLPRPGTKETDDFDAVTFNRAGKVLHVMDRIDAATPKRFDAFVDRVIAAKQARIRAGDIGGAILVAPSFDGPCIERYTKRLDERSAAFFSIDQQLTGYAGFVRIGARRGFHLLLVEERGDELVPLFTAW